MTRQEQILAASMSHADKAWKGEHEHVAFKTITMADFSAGAMWADQHPQWIPVEEELPKEKQKVLVYMPADERCDHEYMCEALYNYAWHKWEDADEPIELEGITHWMPIVPPRKEDKE